MTDDLRIEGVTLHRMKDAHGNEVHAVTWNGDCIDGETASRITEWLQGIENKGMTLDEYQAEAVKTLHPGADVIYLAGKLMCEAAEVAEPLLKLRYHEKPIQDGALVSELGDVLWYAAALAQVLGVSLGDVAAMNVAKLRQRHGAAYNAAHYRTAVLE